MSRVDRWMTFVDAIEALGGRVLPKHVHDDPLEVDVPVQYRARAEALIRKLVDDIKRLKQS